MIRLCHKIDIHEFKLNTRISTIFFGLLSSTFDIVFSVCRSRLFNAHYFIGSLSRESWRKTKKKIAKNNALFFQSLIMIQLSFLWQRSRQNLDKANSLCAKYTMSFTLASHSMNNILHISYREVFAIFLLRFNILHIWTIV